jgi:hypothetical protein
MMQSLDMSLEEIFLNLTTSEATGEAKEEIKGEVQ